MKNHSLNHLATTSTVPKKQAVSPINLNLIYEKLLNVEINRNLHGGQKLNYPEHNSRHIVLSRITHLARKSYKNNLTKKQFALQVNSSSQLKKV